MPEYNRLSCTGKWESKWNFVRNSQTQSSFSDFLVEGNLKRQSWEIVRVWKISRNWTRPLIRCAFHRYSTPKFHAMLCLPPHILGPWGRVTRVGVVTVLAMRRDAVCVGNTQHWSCAYLAAVCAPSPSPPQCPIDFRLCRILKFKPDIILNVCEAFA
jgi:hypothetical protein